MVERKQTFRSKDASTRALSISSIIIFIITFLSHSLSLAFFFFSRVHRLCPHAAAQPVVASVARVFTQEQQVSRRTFC